MTIAAALSCVRSAWLVLGSKTLQLDNPAGGWACSSLDLGYPVVRAVMTDRPDADGSIDRTQLMGARTVTAALVAVDSMSPTQSVDSIAAQFAPFMVPSARPVLHYVLDRPGAAERTLTLRAVTYDWPIVGPVQRDIALQWIAADPIAKDPTIKTSTATAGTPGLPGRQYNLTFPRTYPAGSSSSANAVILSPGDVGVKPQVAIYGPITQPGLAFLAGSTRWYLNFLSTCRIDVGHRIDVDCDHHTAWYDGDRTQNMLGQMDWSSSSWPLIPAGVSTTMTLTGQSTSPATQAVVTWQDGYLT